MGMAASPGTDLTAAATGAAALPAGAGEIVCAQPASSAATTAAAKREDVTALMGWSFSWRSQCLLCCIGAAWPPPSAVTGALTSCVNCFLLAMSSKVSVTGTVSPPLSCCFSSISITW